MEIINIKFSSFNYRFWVSTGERWGLLFLVCMEMIALLSDNSFLLILNLTITPLYLLLSLRNFIRAKKYLTRIEIDDNLIYLSFVNFNKQLDRVEIPLADFRIDITENFSDKFLRFKLEFKRKSLTEKYDYLLIHRQYEIGEWTMELQKKVYKLIRNRQGKFSGTASIGKSIFG